MSDNKKRNQTVIVLGFFDTIHIGHREVIKKALKTAKELKSKAVVFSFKKPIKGILFGGEEKAVYTESERKDILKQLGVKSVFIEPTKEFLSMTYNEFLSWLDKKFDISAYVCGENYTFGKNAEGNAEKLLNHAKKLSKRAEIVKTVRKKDGVVSTTDIKRLLEEGKIKKANALLGENYFIKGKVNAGRHVGRILGFPTANVSFNKDKFCIKQGVYYGFAEFSGEKYKAVINFGSQPTFGKNKVVPEACIIDFNGDIYGKEIKLSFSGYLRNVKKFKTEEDLAEQLKKDYKTTKEKEYD